MIALGTVACITVSYIHAYIYYCCTATLTLFPRVERLSRARTTWPAKQCLPPGTTLALATREGENLLEHSKK